MSSPLRNSPGRVPLLDSFRQFGDGLLKQIDIAKGDIDLDVGVSGLPIESDLAAELGLQDSFVMADTAAEFLQYHPDGSVVKTTVPLLILKEDGTGGESSSPPVSTIVESNFSEVSNWTRLQQNATYRITADADVDVEALKGFLDIFNGRVLTLIFDRLLGRLPMKKGSLLIVETNSGAKKPVVRRVRLINESGVEIFSAYAAGDLEVRTRWLENGEIVLKTFKVRPVPSNGGYEIIEFDKDGYPIHNGAAISKRKKPKKSVVEEAFDTVMTMRIDGPDPTPDWKENLHRALHVLADANFGWDPTPVNKLEGTLSADRVNRFLQAKNPTVARADVIAAGEEEIGRLFAIVRPMIENEGRLKGFEIPEEEVAPVEQMPEEYMLPSAGSVVIPVSTLDAFVPLQYRRIRIYERLIRKLDEYVGRGLASHKDCHILLEKALDLCGRALAIAARAESVFGLQPDDGVDVALSVLDALDLHLPLTTEEKISQKVVRDVMAREGNKPKSLADLVAKYSPEQIRSFLDLFYGDDPRFTSVVDGITDAAARRMIEAFLFYRIARQEKTTVINLPHLKFSVPGPLSDYHAVAAAMDEFITFIPEGMRDQIDRKRIAALAMEYGLDGKLNNQMRGPQLRTFVARQIAPQFLIFHSDSAEAFLMRYFNFTQEETDALFHGAVVVDPKWRNEVMRRTVASLGAIYTERGQRHLINLRAFVSMQVEALNKAIDLSEKLYMLRFGTKGCPEEFRAFVVDYVAENFVGLAVAFEVSDAENVLHLYLNRDAMPSGEIASEDREFDPLDGTKLFSIVDENLVRKFADNLMSSLSWEWRVRRIVIGFREKLENYLLGLRSAESRFHSNARFSSFAEYVLQLIRKVDNLCLVVEAESGDGVKMFETALDALNMVLGMRADWLVANSLRAVVEKWAGSLNGLAAVKEKLRTVDFATELLADIYGVERTDISEQLAIFQSEAARRHYLAVSFVRLRMYQRYSDWESWVGQTGKVFGIARSVADDFAVALAARSLDASFDRDRIAIDAVDVILNKPIRPKTIVIKREAVRQILKKNIPDGVDPAPLFRSYYGVEDGDVDGFFRGEQSPVWRKYVFGKILASTESYREINAAGNFIERKMDRLDRATEITLEVARSLHKGNIGEGSIRAAVIDYIVARDKASGERVFYFTEDCARQILDQM